MKIVLLQEERYIPCYHGSNKSNRALLEALARAGHDCNALCAVLPRGTPLEAFFQDMERRGIAVASAAPDLLSFRHNGVRVHGMPRSADVEERAMFLVARLRDLQPDIVLVSSSSGSYQLRSALDAASDRTIYLAHGHHDLPFGPDAQSVEPSRSSLLRQAAAVVTVSQYGADYLRKHGGIEAHILRFPVYGDGPFPNLGSFDRGSVTLARSAVSKGVGIFIGLARKFPRHAFAAARWGAGPDTLAELGSLPNVTTFDPCDDIEAILAPTNTSWIRSARADNTPCPAFGAMAGRHSRRRFSPR